MIIFSIKVPQKKANKKPTVTKTEDGKIFTVDVLAHRKNLDSAKFSVCSLTLSKKIILGMMFLSLQVTGLLTLFIQKMSVKYMVDFQKPPVK